jgi:hypothetical protein
LGKETYRRSQLEYFRKRHNKVNRKVSQLQEEHKQHLLELFDKNLQATKQDAVDSLTQAFERFNLKKTVVDNFILYDYKKNYTHPTERNSPETLEERYDWVISILKTDMDFLSNCVFVDEAAFNINMRSPFGRSISGTPAIEETPSTRAVSHTILGAISAVGVVSVDLREPIKPKKIKVVGGSKRQRLQKDAEKKPIKKGTTAGH